MIHVAVSLHDLQGHYSKFANTLIVSMFEITNYQTTIHVLHDNTLTLDAQDKFSYIAGKYTQEIKFYNVEEKFTDNIKLITNTPPSPRI